MFESPHRSAQCVRTMLAYNCSITIARLPSERSLYILLSNHPHFDMMFVAVRMKLLAGLGVGMSLKA